MSETSSFQSHTERLGLPLLFSGQAQKEFFLNQSLAVLDAAIQLSVEESSNAPPATVADGTAYRVLPDAIEDWANHDNKIAVRVSGAWHYIEPSEGMQLFDKSAARFMLFNGSWQSPLSPVAPTGGSVVDSEARDAITELVEALQVAGILANPQA